MYKLGQRKCPRCSLKVPSDQIAGRTCISCKTEVRLRMQKARKHSIEIYDQGLMTNKHYIYGMNLEQYIELLRSQEHKCQICKRELPSKKNHIDHCHKTGIVRGILCISCNTGLGHFKDDPEMLRQAVLYLETSKTQYVHIKHRSPTVKFFRQGLLRTLETTKEV